MRLLCQRLFLAGLSATAEGQCRRRTANVQSAEVTMPLVIDHFSGTYLFLSNFYYCPIEFEGLVYPSVEHAFQAAKTLDPEERMAIRDCPTCAEAKQKGRSIALRANWNQLKIKIMAELLRLKFSQGHLHVLLVKTGDAHLIEGNSWDDQFWGCVRIDQHWVGQNNLGKLLMQLRTELTHKPPL